MEGAAARDFGCSQGGEAGASPQRAVTAESTPATAKRPAARRVLRVWACGILGLPLESATLPCRASPFSLFLENGTPTEFSDRLSTESMQRKIMPNRTVRPLTRRRADFRPLQVDSLFGEHWRAHCPHSNHLSLFVWIRVHSWLNCISPV